jgi:hypothetical protein
MGRTSSHISWRMAGAERGFATALGRLGLAVRELSSQTWDRRTATIGGVRDIELVCLAAIDDAWSFALMPLNAEHAGEPLGVAVARQLAAITPHPVLAFFEQDQLAWGYSLFAEGALLDRFCNRPDIAELEPHECAGDADLLASRFGADPRVIGRYLASMVDDAAPGKVAADDEFELDDHWVRCDLMKRLGLHYAVGEPGARRVALTARTSGGREGAGRR